MLCKKEDKKYTTAFLAEMIKVIIKSGKKCYFKNRPLRGNLHDLRSLQKENQAPNQNCE